MCNSAAVFVHTSPTQHNVCPGDFVGTQLNWKRGHSPPAQFSAVYIVAGCKIKFSVKFVISALKNVYRDVLHANMNQKNKILFFPPFLGAILNISSCPRVT